MSIQSCFNSFLRRYGNTVVIRRNGRAEAVKAFVQPLRRWERRYFTGKAIPAGRLINEYQQMLCDCRHRFDSRGDTVIVFRGKEYIPVNTDEFVIGDQEVYFRAVLSPKKETKEDDYDVIDR